MSAGIDRISFYTPHYFTDIEDLAIEKNINKNVIFRTVGQEKNSVISKNEDIISMALNATSNIIEEDEKFDMLIFATETAFDYSKAAALYLTNHLKINKNCICFEVKQACYSSTAALVCGINYIKNNPNSKVLIISSDVAKYETGTNGEFTNGAGAVAFILSSNPKLIKIEDNFYSIHEDAYDFFKPEELDYPIVFGKESVDLYLDFFQKCYKNLKEKNFDLMLCHMPFPVIFNKVCSINSDFQKFLKYSKEIKNYSSNIGNIYTASLYLSICSMFDNIEEDLSGQEILFFAYGSGAMATMFSGKIVNGYKNHIKTDLHKKNLENRQKISYSDSLKNYQLNTEKDIYTLREIIDYKRFYSKNE